MYAEREPEEEQGELTPNNRHGYLLIYRIFENLTVNFPGLANLIRRGLEKSKAFNAFGNMSMEDLLNPNYEIPAIGGIATEVPSTSKGGLKSQYHSQKSSLKGLSHASSSLSNISGSLLNQTFRATPTRNKITRLTLINIID